MFQCHVCGSTQGYEDFVDSKPKRSLEVQQPVHLSPPPDVARKLTVLAADAPTSLHALGNVDLLHAHPTLALFCSTKAPARVILRVHDLAQEVETWEERKICE